MEEDGNRSVAYACSCASNSQMKLGTTLEKL
jgi:hypothetical protein